MFFLVFLHTSPIMSTLYTYIKDLCDDHIMYMHPRNQTKLWNGMSWNLDYILTLMCLATCAEYCEYHVLLLCSFMYLTYRVVCFLYYGLWLLHFCLLRDCFQYGLAAHTYSMLSYVSLFLGHRPSVTDVLGSTTRLVYCHRSLVVVECTRHHGTWIVCCHPTFQTRYMNFPDGDFIYQRFDQSGDETRLVGMPDSQRIYIGTTQYIFTEESHGLSLCIVGPTRGAYPIQDNHVSAPEYRRARKRLRQLMNLRIHSCLPTVLWDLILDYFLFLPDMPFPIRRIK